VHFSDQLSGLIRCGETNRIASGEFDVFALSCNQRDALLAKAKGAPIGFTLADDVPLVYLVYTAVPKHAAHPAAAKLFINYLLSREAQDTVYEFDYIDSHLLPGSKTAQELEKLQASGVQLTLFTIERLQSRGESEAELDEALSQIQQIFRKQ
jgi:iron(III) transport system substrate-binding protein